MKEIFLTHYYYGDRLSSFKAGLGTIIRAKGHSLKVKIIALNNSFEWLREQDALENFNVEFFNFEQLVDSVQTLRKYVDSSVPSLILIANFDLLIENSILKLERFIDIIKSRQQNIEIILTGEKHYPDIEKLADYVSLFHLAKN